MKQGGLDADAGTELYFNFEQAPSILNFAPNQMNLVLQASQPLAGLVPGIRSAVAAMDPALPVIQLRTMEDVIGASLTRQRFLSMLLGIFAAVALALAAIGTYGILAYMVAERQREIGIRMALGAGNSAVVKLVLKQGVSIAAVGIAIGLGGALALSRLTSSLLYGVSPSDPLTFGTVAAVITLVAITACLVPIRRATRVDPLASIRADGGGQSRMRLSLYPSSPSPSVPVAHTGAFRSARFRSSRCEFAGPPPQRRLATTCSA